MDLIFARAFGRFRRLLAVLSSLVMLAAVMVGVTATQAQAASSERHLYWTVADEDDPSIGRAKVNGSGVNQNFISGLGLTFGIAANTNNLYLGNSNEDQLGIDRTKLDGSSVVKSLIKSDRPVYGMVTDSKYVYWAGAGKDQPEMTIGRARLDGSGINRKFITKPVAEDDSVIGLTTDGKYIYWMMAEEQGESGSIGRAKLDGSGAKLGFIKLGSFGFGLTTSSGYLYWTDPGRSTIGRAKSNGTAVNRSFIKGVGQSVGIAADDSNVYWTSPAIDGDGVPVPGAGAIGRAKLNGSGVNKKFISGLTAPYTLALTPGRLPQQLRPGASPKRVKSRGTTLLNKGRAKTRQVRPVTAKVRVKMNRGEISCLRVIKGKSRKLSVRTYGKCGFTLRVTYTAPGNSKLFPLKVTKTYRVKR